MYTFGFRYRPGIGGSVKKMLKKITPGISKKVSLPVYGAQDRGVSPGGPADCFSVTGALALLGCEESGSWECYETVLPGVWEWEEDCIAVLTGAPYRGTVLKKISGETVPVADAVPFFAPAGSRLIYGQRTAGFRTYLTSVPVADATFDWKSRRLPDIGERYAWAEFGTIRVLLGPEHQFLSDSHLFTDTYWKIGNDSDDRGLRLEGPSLKVGMGNMVSDAVADGTVQLTPKGPIILLHSRQTVGGYPRIYNIISADVDLLAQYIPGQILHFKEVTVAEARRTAREKRNLAKVIYF